jgi:hypothetical protein
MRRLTPEPAGWVWAAAEERAAEAVWEAEAELVVKVREIMT